MGQSIETKKLIANLERWRTAHNLSQSEFAKMLGVKPSTYSKVLSGETNKISADTIKAIYDVTGKMCFQLMECRYDEFLRLLDKLQELTPRELAYMNQFVDVYIEAKRRTRNEG